MFSEESLGNFVDLPSGRVHYVKAGQGDPVILLHGSGPGATAWSNFAENIRVLSESFTCYGVDMPGWGKSDTAAGDERDHARTVVEFLDALGLASASFIGNSMGGSTAIRVAVESPERVTKVVAMGPGASGAKLYGAGDGPTEGLKILRAAYENPTIESMTALTGVMTYGTGEVSTELAEKRLEGALARPDHLESYLTTPRNLRDYPGEAQLAGITAPVMLIHGRDDRVVHYENSLRLATVIPNSRLVLLNRCGHWAQVEHADEFNALVATFLA